MRAHALAAAALVVGLVPSAALSQTPGAAQAPGITSTPLPPSQLFPEPSPPPPPSPQPGQETHHGQGTPSPSAPGGDLFLAGPKTYAPRYNRPPRSSRGSRVYPTGPYTVGGYLPVSPIPVSERSRRVVQENRSGHLDGYLRLRVTPGTARVLVDSSYVGTVDEVSSRAGGLALEPGPHRVRIEADGFEPVTFDVEIVAGEFVSHVRDLVSPSARPAAPLASATPKTFYVIPGCYAGDSPPQASWLPEGCLTANLRAVPPELSRVQP